MNCQDFENQIQELLDLRADLNREPALICHASVCESCARKLELYGDLFSQVNSPEHSVELDQAFSDDLEISKSALRVQRLAGVLAASVALAMVVWLSFMSDRNSSNDHRFASTKPSAPGALEFHSSMDDGMLAKAEPFESQTDDPLQSELQKDNPATPGSFNAYASSGIMSPGFVNPAIVSPTMIAPGSPGVRTNSNLQIPGNNGYVLSSLSQITPTANQMRRPIQSLQAYYQYTSALPGVKPWTSGLNHAARMIQKSIEDKPDRSKKSNGKELGGAFDSIDWSFRTMA